MNVPRLLTIGLIALSCAAVASRAGARDAERIYLDQKFNEPLSMQKYGGPHKELIVLETDQDAIRYAIVDYTRMIRRLRTTGQVQPGGSSDNSYVQVPTVTRQKRKKSDPAAGSSRLDGLYLLFEDAPSGLKIYLKDTLATPQDSVRLRIVPGKH